jgi:hypothetical protein
MDNPLFQFLDRTKELVLPLYYTSQLEYRFKSHIFLSSLYCLVYSL